MDNSSSADNQQYGGGAGGGGAAAAAAAAAAPRPEVEVAKQRSQMLMVDGESLRLDTLKWLREVANKWQMTKEDVCIRCHIPVQKFEQWYTGQHGYDFRITQIVRTWIKAMCKEHAPELLSKTGPNDAGGNLGVAPKEPAVPVELVRYAGGELTDHLVPVRFDIEVGAHCLRDVLLWNVHEKKLSPEQYAQYMCEQLDLPPASFCNPIAAAIREAIQTFPRKSRNAEGESLHKIRLELRVGDVAIQDQFLWDINSPLADPAAFARQLVQDMRLPREFTGLIDHAIREQIGRIRRAMWEEDYQEADAAGPITQIVRSRQDLEQWGPVATQLTQAEMELVLKQQKRRRY